MNLFITAYDNFMHYKEYLIAWATIEVIFNPDFLTLLQGGLWSNSEDSSSAFVAWYEWYCSYYLTDMK